MGNIPPKKTFEKEPHWTLFDRPIILQNGEELSVKGFHAPSDTAGITFVFISGLNSPPSSYIDFAKFLNAQGIGFLQVSLPENRPHQTMIQDFMEVPKALYYGENAIVREFVPENHKKIGLGHSTGSLVSLATMIGIQQGNVSSQLLDIADEMSDYLDGYIHISPFLDTANSSRRFHWFKNLLYSVYASLRKDANAASSFIDRWHLRRTGTSEEDIEYLRENGPTHGHNLALKTEAQLLGKAMERRVNSRVHSPSRLPQIFIHSSRDNCACHKTAARHADLIGAKLHDAPGMHNPINDDGGEHRNYVMHIASHFIASLQIAQISLARHSQEGRSIFFRNSERREPPIVVPS